MTQYERIAHFEVVLKLRDQRRQRMAGMCRIASAMASVATAAWLINT